MGSILTLFGLTSQLPETLCSALDQLNNCNNNKHQSPIHAHLKAENIFCHNSSVSLVLHCQQRGINAQSPIRISCHSVRNSLFSFAVKTFSKDPAFWNLSCLQASFTWCILHSFSFRKTRVLLNYLDKNAKEIAALTISLRQNFSSHVWSALKE